MTIINYPLSEILSHRSSLIRKVSTAIPLSVPLRATKDTEAAKSLSGIYDDMEEDNLTFTLDDGNELPVLLKIPETLPCKVYEFAISDVNYSFEYSGQMSQMMFAEVFDSVLVAIGANGTDTE